jgi:hypothetical protein
MKKPHGNTGKKNALKSGRTKSKTVRITPQVHEYLESGKTSAGDKIERLVLNEIEREVVMSEWIKVGDDKPKCNVFVFYKNNHSKGRVVKARWIGRFEEPVNDEDCLDSVVDGDGNEWWPEGWYEQIDNWVDFTSVYIIEGEVTHWMPLPKPPTI